MTAASKFDRSPHRDYALGCILGVPDHYSQSRSGKRRLGVRSIETSIFEFENSLTAFQLAFDFL